MDVEKAFKEIESLLLQKQLPHYSLLFNLLTETSECLDLEIENYRPAAESGNAGSFLDFRNSSIPVVVVPDLHARPFFLLNILKYKFSDGKTVFEKLAANSLLLVFVGDILHSERKAKERWVAARVEFEEEIFTGPAISAEMQEGLSLMTGLFKLKTLFPKNCHILKGNHENIYNVTRSGDYGFRKYADEGNMCRIFLQEQYGDDIVYLIHCIESGLPLFFAGKNCTVSHAEPKKFYTKNELINARTIPDVVEGLTWTANDDAQADSVELIHRELYKETQTDNCVHLGGHRPVTGKFSARQQNRYIQIHNPSRQNVAVVNPEVKFNPETDIVEVGNE